MTFDATQTLISAAWECIYIYQICSFGDEAALNIIKPLSSLSSESGVATSAASKGLSSGSKIPEQTKNISKHQIGYRDLHQATAATVAPVELVDTSSDPSRRL